MEKQGYKGAKTLDGSQEDIEGIKAALSGFYEGLSEHDLETCASHTAPGFHLLEHGEYWSLGFMKTKIGPNKPLGFSRTNRFDFKLIQVNGDHAFAVWDLYAEVTRNETVTNLRWLESGSFKKAEGIWKTHMLHSTRVPKD